MRLGLYKAVLDELTFSSRLLSVGEKSDYEKVIYQSANERKN